MSLVNSRYTLEVKHGSPENQPLEKETPIGNHHFSGSMLNFGGGEGGNSSKQEWVGHFPFSVSSTETMAGSIKSQASQKKKTQGEPEVMEGVFPLRCSFPLICFLDFPIIQEF